MNFHVLDSVYYIQLIKIKQQKNLLKIIRITN